MKAIRWAPGLCIQSKIDALLADSHEASWQTKRPDTFIAIVRHDSSCGMRWSAALPHRASHYFRARIRQGYEEFPERCTRRRNGDLQSFAVSVAHLSCVLVTSLTAATGAVIGAAAGVLRAPFFISVSRKQLAKYKEITKELMRLVTEQNDIIRSLETENDALRNMAATVIEELEVKNDFAARGGGRQAGYSGSI